MLSTLAKEIAGLQGCELSTLSIDLVEVDDGVARVRVSAMVGPLPDVIPVELVSDWNTTREEPDGDREPTAADPA